MYSSETEFQNALQADGITSAELDPPLVVAVDAIALYRLPLPAWIQIPAADVQAYYRQQVSEWEQKGIKPIPTFEESRDQIEEILTQKRIDQALDQWIKDTQNQVAINYLDPALQ